jgi:8-oxo-dGTP diphosphatase
MCEVTIAVAVSIVRDAGGRVLLAQRTARQVSAGFWELPGGKIDAGESAAEAAARELHEEVGIEALALRPWTVYEHAFPRKRVRLHFFRVEAWRGQPHGKEGQRLAWVDPAAPAVGPVLPSNRRILAQLGLPPVYAVVGPDDAASVDALLARLTRALRAGLRLVQVRAAKGCADQRVQLARRIAARAHPFGARVMLAASALEARRACADGVHSPASELRRMTARPPVDLWSASCHDAADLARAVALGADFTVVSPVLATASHPGHVPLGFDGLRRQVATAAIPVYAQGGTNLDHLDEALRAGASGIALSLAALEPVVAPS